MRSRGKAASRKRAAPQTCNFSSCGAAPKEYDAARLVWGRRIVYVSGRPGSNHAFRRWVESAGGEPTVHDGGVEDSKGLLAAALAGADLAVFPWLNGHALIPGSSNANKL